MKNKFVKTLLKNNKSDDNFTKILLSNGSKILNVHKVEPNTFELIQNEIKNVIENVSFNLLPYNKRRFEQAGDKVFDNPELEISHTMQFTKNPWDDNIIIEKSMNYLNKFLIDHVIKYLDDINIVPDIKPFIKNSWMTKSSQGKLLKTHTHCKACISGTYYYKTNKDSGNICFYSPEDKPNLFKDKIEIQPEDGMVVIFPGMLPHSVLENKSSEDRYGISFNVQIYKNNF